jgi:hypothetical protein
MSCKFSCSHPNCSRRFRSKKAFKCHLLSHTRGEKDNEHGCEICKRSFSTKSNLKRHQHFFHTSNQFKCEDPLLSSSERIAVEALLELSNTPSTITDAVSLCGTPCKKITISFNNSIKSAMMPCPPGESLSRKQIQKLREFILSQL